MARPRKYEGTTQERKIKTNNEWIKKNLKQLNIKMTPALYQKLHEEAKRKGISVRRLCINALTEIVDKTETIKQNE